LRGYTFVAAIARSIACVSAWLLASCAGLQAKGSCQNGEISFYAQKFDGRKTANGEIFRNEGMTAAHRNLAFGTRLQVRVDGKRVHVRVNDRGPFVRTRILDVSAKAARELGFVQRGHAVAEVCVE
jgi:rare lipoprotein A